MRICSAIGLIGLMTLTGCATFGTGEAEFDCPDAPDGAPCQSARTVYENTHHGPYEATPREELIEQERQRDSEIPEGYGPPEEEQAREDARADHDRRELASQASQPELGGRPAHRPQLYPRLDEPLPVRSPAQVMRIWYQPWEDKNGDLVNVGRVYTEIEERQWSIGEQPDPSGQPNLRPLQMDQEDDDEDRDRTGAPGPRDQGQGQGQDQRQDPPPGQTPPGQIGQPRR